jgi:arylsulfatase
MICRPLHPLNNHRYIKNMKTNKTIYDAVRVALLSGTVLALTSVMAFAQNGQAPVYQGQVGKTLAESKEWWPAPVKVPKGVPNVIWILLDDVGFGATSAFGGVINTPTYDSLANNGLRYTNFHTAAICAPTRAALLTGRNHHYVHMGGFAHTILSAGFPGYDGRIPADKGTIAEILRENGYNTFAVGKYGLTPDEDATDAGPFDRWPSGKGFDHFFGFLGSQTDQYKPDLVEDNAHVTPDGRHLSEQITDKAISYITRQHKVAPDKPFFLYYAPGATHAPHQVAKEWSDLYKGKFDEGWDVFREKVFAEQKRKGIIPKNAVLPPRNAGIKAWNTLSADEKKLYARFMEVYAGYLTYTDHETERLISYLKQSDQLDNTLIFVVIGDNGASKEGSQNGDIDRSILVNGQSESETIKYNLNKIDEIGTPEGTEANYPLGWAQAANTPFKYWKQDANSEGGTRNPLIVFYPKGIKDKGGIRTQYGHVSDLLPTTLEFLGIKLPEYIKGVKQDTLQGTSLVYSFDNANAPARHNLQYYYIFGSRSIYKDGWKAEAAHNSFFFNTSRNAADTSRDYNKDKWELYNLNQDFNERIDLAAKYPEKLKELQALFDEQAKKNNIYPFIDWDDVFKLRIHKRSSFGKPNQQSMINTTPPNPQK